MSASSIRIRALLWKEWLELRQLKALLWGAIGVPILFTVIPLAVLFAMTMMPTSEMDDMKDLIAVLGNDPAFARLDMIGQMQVAMGRPMSMFLLLLPVMIPSLVASYSIVGEKTSQTLEPLLATPIRTWELLFGKMLTAFLPTIALTWFFAVLFAIGVRLIASSDGVFALLIGAPWLLSVLLLSPALSMIAIAITVGISSRAKDPRSAQEVSAMLVIPIVLTIPGQLSGFIFIDATVVLVASLVLAAMASIAIWIVARLFDREWILTRWR